MEVAMIRISRLPKAIAAVGLTLIALGAEALAEAVPPNLPAAVICYAPADQSWRVGYLYRIKKDGDAMYLTPDGKLSMIVDAKGVAVAPDNRPAGADCYGKTLDELRSSGRTMEFQRAK
jgi:hypothetical protein